MKKTLILFALLLVAYNFSFAQTSWTGLSSDNWSSSSNWTNGVPNENTDVFIGNASFTGAHQPEVNGNSKCKDLIIGNGTISSSLTIKKNLTIYGNFFIGTNGTINANTNKTITLVGNWTNNGSYNATNNSARVTFSGENQTVTGVTTFNKIRINSSATVTLSNNIVVNKELRIYGKINPTALYNISGTGDILLKDYGYLYVFAENFADNYLMSGDVNLSRFSYVEYASSSITQYISSNLKYGRLRISGGSTKELTDDLPSLYSNHSNAGRIYIDEGILDLKTHTANRGNNSGGYFLLAENTTLRIGGTNGFPENYDNTSIASTSTIEYYGNNQTIEDLNYGNLVFSGTSGSVVKAMPNTSLTIYGNFTVNKGSATSLSFTAQEDIECKKDITLGSNTTFNGNSFTHTFRGNWSNNGTFEGATSMCYFRGVGAELNGTGTNNFHNLKFRADNITANGNTNINVSDDISAGWGGVFTHNDGGTITMTGSNTSIYGDGLTFNNLILSDTITSSDPFKVNGNFTCNGHFTASSGNIIYLNGTNKSILGTGFISFYRTYVNGTITTARDFTMRRDLYVSPYGSFTATNGIATFDYYSTLNGRADLYNVVINSSKTLKLAVNSTLGIANTFTRNGNLSMTSTAPNTVEYNGSGNQDVISEDYVNLVFATGGKKTAIGNIDVKNNITINSGVEFDASSFDIDVYNDWINNGTFTPSTSTVEFKSSNISNIIGTTTFNILEIDKSSSSIHCYLKNNVTASSIIMNKGILDTENNAITTTGNRSGNGYIYGTITHNHAFSAATPYYFEGPNNSISFITPSIDLTSVTVKVTPDEVTDFDPTKDECINREYEITIPSGTYTSAILRFHYEDYEMNAFEEPFLAIYKYNSGTTWDSLGYTSRDTSANYIEHIGLTSIPGRYAFAGSRKVIEWNGSVSTAWENPLNWTTISGSDPSNRVPTSTDAAKIGTSTFTNQPTVNSAQKIAALRFGSAKAVTLTLNDSLTTVSSVKGKWAANKSHTINVGSSALIVGSNFDLSDGTAGNDISLTIGSGYVQVDRALNQKANGNITFTSTGNLTINGNYNYIAGAFNAGSGTVTYSGAEYQKVAPFTYNNLSFTKSNESAIINNPTVVNGNIETSIGGTFVLNDSLYIIGDITIGNSTEFANKYSAITTLGNWTNNGTYTSYSGNVNFIGTANQTVNNSTFGDIEIDKSSGTLTLTGDIYCNGNLSITNGTLNLDTYTANRAMYGGTFNLNSGTTLLVGGANNFPSYFASNLLDSLSNVVYNAAVNQEVYTGITYGNLSFSNGTVNPKNIEKDISILSNLTINNGATISIDSANIYAYGNIINNGTITPGKSNLILEGTSKTLSGPLTLHSLTVNGDYTVTSGLTSMTGDFYIEQTGSLNFGNNDASLDGDLINKGSLTSSGAATFTGTRVQTLQLLNAINSTSTGIINFNGTIPPVISSTSSPNFATVNINNTGGIKASMPWSVFVACNIANGASFDGGAMNHIFYGNFTNNGTVVSTGKLTFSPGAPFSLGASIQLDGTSFNSTGDVVFAGTGEITITDNAPTFNNVIVSNTHGNGVTAPSDWIINNELYIASGSEFNAGTNTTHTIAGGLLNNGNLDGETSTITLTDSTNINGTGTTNFYSLKIDAGANTILNKEINIAKNLTANGNLNALDRKVTFIGNSVSKINGSTSDVTFSTLELNKSNYTDLEIPVNVTEELTLVNGYLNASSINILTLNDEATSTPGNDNSFVDGPMKKIGDDAFVFPLGNSGKWARLGISAPSNPTDAFVAEYYYYPYSDTVTMAATPTPALNNVSKNEYWTCDRANGSSDVKVQLFWENAVESGISDYTSDLVVAHWNGSAWENAGQSAITASNPGNVTSNTVSSFSPFTFGSLSGGINSLPIELLSFNAKIVNEIVELKWETTTEINNDYFSIERSIDGKNFETIQQINGAGNSYSNLNYTSYDKSPFDGISYYRLKQTDFNGDFTYSSIVSIINNDAPFSYSVFPNPNRGKEINVSISKTNKPVTITIVDIRGEIIYNEHFNSTKQISIAPENELTDGIYFVSITNENVKVTQKLIVN